MRNRNCNPEMKELVKQSAQTTLRKEVTGQLEKQAGGDRYQVSEKTGKPLVKR